MINIQDQKRINDALEVALAMAVDDGTRYLENMFAGDENRLVREKALSMLADCHQAITTKGMVPETGYPGDPIIPQEKIGPYRISRCLGEGGMGVVYLGMQESPKRQVAVKVLKTGTLIPSQKVRFLMECSTLALLDHPCIATLYESGVDDNKLPWFAMEYINGVPISEYVENRNLSCLDVLRLFVQVCDGIGHIHQKNILHRDIKPSNILVADPKGLSQMSGAPHPQVKIVDFGVAKALESGNEDTPQMTVTGARLGTLTYMAPEIFSGAKLLGDIQVDVYSLGVLLYQLLTGMVPFDLGNDGELDLVLRVQEELPPRPSSKKRFPAHELRGDIDAIVHKALAKNPDERYLSVADFKSDVLAVLEHRPVVARSVTNLYLMRKFVRRHWKPVLVAAAFIVTLMTAAVVSFMERQAAKVEADLAEESLALIVEVLSSVDPYAGQGKDTKIADVLADTGIKAAQLNKQPRLQLTVYTTIAKVYLGLGDLELADQYMKKATLVSEVLHRGKLVPSVKLLRGRVLHERGEYQAAKEIFQEVLDHAPPISKDAFWGRLRLAQACRVLGEVEQAKAAYGICRDDAVRLFGQRSTEELQALLGQASTERDLGNLEGALTLYQKVLISQKLMYGETHPHIAETHQNIGVVLLRSGEPETALKHFQAAQKVFKESIGNDHSRTIRVRINIQASLLRLERYKEAVAFGRKTVGLLSSSVGETHKKTLRAKLSLALALKHLKQYEEAEALLIPAHTVQLERAGDHDPDTLMYAHNLGSLYLAMGKYGEAEELLNNTLRKRQQARGLIHRNTILTQLLLAEAYLEQYRWETAKLHLEELHNLTSQVKTLPEFISAIVSGYLGYVYCQKGQPTEAAPFFESAMNTLEALSTEYQIRITAYIEECQGMPN